MAHEIDFTNYGYAPTDWYSFSSFFFAIDTTTNKSIPIIGFEISNAGSNSFSTISETSPSKSNFVNNGSSTTVVVDSMVLFAKIQRPVAALAITYSMFAINWVLAIFSIMTTLIASFWEVDIVVALLPITIILTVPTLRAIYVSAPFGVFLGAYQKTLLPSRRLTVLFRCGGILPADVDSGVVHRDSVVQLWDRGHPGRTSYQWEFQRRAQAQDLTRRPAAAVFFFSYRGIYDRVI